MKASRVVGNNIRRIRVAAGLSQDALALEAELDRAYVGRIERGSENPTVATLERLANTLKVPLVELFKTGQPTASPLKGGRRPSKR